MQCSANAITPSIWYCSRPVTTKWILIYLALHLLVATAGERPGEVPHVSPAYVHLLCSYHRDSMLMLSSVQEQEPGSRTDRG
jgi:hypothetical protein